MLLSAFDDKMPQRWESPSAVAHVLTEAGFQYRMIYPTQLADGVLDSGDFRMLYLPYCQAMSRGEIDAVRKFAANGGVVLADLRPAVADEHGKPYASGALDDLFGVTQQTSRAQAVTAEFAGVPKVRGDGSIKLNGGKARASLGSAPAAISNDRGILLNLAPGDLLVGNLVYDASFVTDTAANAVRELMHDLLAPHGITPALITEPQVPGCHVFRHELTGGGGPSVISLIWDAPAFLPGIRYSEDEKIEKALKWQKTVKLHLPEARHVYRILGGEYLGQTDTIEQSMQPGDVQLYAALPYKVSAVRIEVSDGVRQGGALRFRAQLNAEGDAIGLHIVRVELIGPDGQLAPHYSRNLSAPKGQAAGTIDLALNDQPGPWQLRVRDAATGVHAVKRFSVTPRADGV